MNDISQYTVGNGQSSGVVIRKTNLVDAYSPLVGDALKVGSPETYRMIHIYNLALTDVGANYPRLRSKGSADRPGSPSLSFALRVLSRPHEFEQVRGSSFFAEYLHKGPAKGVRHYFLGGTPATPNVLNR